MVGREAIAVLKIDVERDDHVEFSLAAGESRVIAGPTTADRPTAAVGEIALRAVDDEQIVDHHVARFGIKADDVVPIPVGFEIGLGLEALVKFRRIAPLPVGQGEIVEFGLGVEMILGNPIVEPAVPSVASP